MPSTPLTPAEVQARASRVRLLLLDVDGVLTDGTVSIDSEGGESKRFFIRDGAAIVWAGRQGLEVGFLSGRPSEATSRRAAELGVQIVSQGGPDKRRSYRQIMAERSYADDEVGYMADDLLDLPVLGRVGLSAAPADAVDEVREQVHWTSRFDGGRGAVRELIELILRAHGKWDGLLRSFQVS
jgi:3-deoxy-D-manno-octulosonate 8-phosphate phosphatase (KDO 8-P phosphatase)